MGVEDCPDLPGCEVCQEFGWRPQSEVVRSVKEATGTVAIGSYDKALGQDSDEFLDGLVRSGSNPLQAISVINRLVKRFGISHAIAKQVYEDWRTRRRIERSGSRGRSLADRILHGEDPRTLLE